VQEKDCSSGHY